MAQALAIIPGVSRSGVTISAGLFSGLTREAAARFSFLMSAPIIAGAAVFGLKNLSPALVATPSFWVAVITSAVASAVAVAFLLTFVKRHRLRLFVYYRFALAAVVVAVVFLRR